MKTRNKFQAIVIITSILIVVVMLSQFIGSANPLGSVSNAAAAPQNNSLFVPLVMKNYPLPVVQTIYGAEMFSINSSGGLNQMVDANMSWTRRNAVVWSSIEKSEGVYDWSAMAGLETELRNASSSGIQVILIVRSTPQWARKHAGSGPTCGPMAENKMGAFGNFMQQLVARYSVAPYNVKYWEMWNEQDAPEQLVENIWGCWGDTGDAYNGGGYYAKMLKAAYPKIKAADGQAQVVFGGLLLDCDPRKTGTGGCANAQAAIAPMFLEGALKDGAGPYFDGLSFHGYDYYDYVDWNNPAALGKYGNGGWQSAWNTTGPVTVAKVEFIKSMLTKYSATGKFLMNTEVALICGDGLGMRRRHIRIIAIRRNLRRRKRIM